jgi:hypothetical protein
MSEDDERFAFCDLNARAREVIRDLTRDGYPERDQWGILIACLCMLLVKGSKDEEQLAAEVENTKEMIDIGVKEVRFKPRKRKKRQFTASDSLRSYLAKAFSVLSRSMHRPGPARAPRLSIGPLSLPAERAHIYESSARRLASFATNCSTRSSG